MYKIQEIFKKFGNDYFNNYGIDYNKLNIYNQIIDCRTNKMGVCIYKCPKCNNNIYLYKSCLNRHCPTCLDYKKEVWLSRHKEDILDINYYHIVLCIPRELNIIFYYNQKIMYNLLFDISSKVLLDICKKYLSLDVGITSILHTWSQTGKYYPHIHMLITGGGINNLGKYIDSKLVSEDIIKTRFKNKLLKEIKKKRLSFYGKYSYLNNYDNYIKYIDNIYNKEFICYKNKPYNSVNDIYEYFSKYAFKICMTNDRIIRYDDKYVYFTYKDYHNKNINRVSRVKGIEFIRRYLDHTLPKNFVKIRYYGILSCKNKIIKMNKLRILTKTKRIKDNFINKINILKKMLGRDVTRCNKCNSKLYLYKETYGNKSPPKYKNKSVLLDA